MLSVGFTDSVYLRQRGVRAYGLAPFLVTTEEAGTMHGDGEHLPAGELVRGLRLLLGVLVEVGSGNPPQSDSEAAAVEEVDRPAVAG